MMTLEIDEYERTLESLQAKLDERVQQLQAAQDEIGRQEKRVEDYKTQIGKFKIMSS
jgi:chromosome segregation ATPase